jgi:hypothetical protein
MWIHKEHTDNVKAIAIQLLLVYALIQQETSTRNGRRPVREQCASLSSEMPL